MLKTVNEWANCSIGKELNFVLFDACVAANGDDPLCQTRPVRFDLQFAGCGHAVIEPGSDGSSIRWRNEKLQNVDMEELAHSIVVFDGTRIEPWKSLIGKRLAQAQFVHSAEDNRDIGIQLNFVADASVSLINLGDELNVFQKIPESISSEMRVSLRSIEAP